MLKRKTFVVPQKTSVVFPDQYSARYGFATQFLKPESSILDAGCGTGIGCWHLAKLGHQVVGVDSDTSNILTAARYYTIGGIHGWILGDIEHGSWQQDFQGFDAVLCLATLEHVKDDEALFDLFAATLTQGKRLVITTMNAKCKTIWAGEENWPRYTDKGLSFLLEKHGFKVDTIAYCDWKATTFNAFDTGMYLGVAATRV